MIDEIFDRHYQAHRAQMNSDIERALGHLGRSVGQAFTSLTRIQFAAPWAASSKGARTN